MVIRKKALSDFKDKYGVDYIYELRKSRVKMKFMISLAEMIAEHYGIPLDEMVELAFQRYPELKEVYEAVLQV